MTIQKTRPNGQTEVDSHPPSRSTPSFTYVSSQQLFNHPYRRSSASSGHNYPVPSYDQSPISDQPPYTQWRSHPPCPQQIPAYAFPLGTQRISQFSGEQRKADVDFEEWKYEVNCLLRSGLYSDLVLLESIRSSLSGKARSVLFLGEKATVISIMSKMKAIYGNAANSEKLKEQFYSASQNDGESVVDYSLRLTRLISSHVDISQEERNEMLCNKLWSGLCNKDLENATRYKFEGTREYSSLRSPSRTGG